MSAVRCPACARDKLRTLHPSRKSGRRRFECRDCGLVGWSDRDTLPLPDFVSTEEISVETRAAWFAAKRTDAVADDWRATIERISGMLGGAEGRSLYDVGAGDGHFLSVAREKGFSVGGNELLEAALTIARDSHGVELDLGDLTTLHATSKFDAITMWCVIAHVPEPDELLRACFDRLKPGGVLFVQTPRRSAVDRAAQGLSQASTGRFAKLVDRRVAEHHWFLHTRTSLTRALEGAGFTDVDCEAVASYGLKAAQYLQSLGASATTAQRVGPSIERAMDLGVMPRLTFHAYARKPH